jgi:predicted transcriptional regulator
MMSEPHIKDLMLAHYQCAIVDEEASLCEAVMVMEATRQMYQRWDYRPRIILVLDKNKQVVGTIRHYDILRALEPLYYSFDLRPNAVGFQVSGLFIDAMYQNLQIWAADLDALCVQSAQLRIKDLMTIPSKTMFIDINTNIREAIHRMLLGNHPSLIVQENSVFVGLLRMSDVASYVIRKIKNTCSVGE